MGVPILWGWVGETSLNIALEPTPDSVRSFLASVSRRGSPPALGAKGTEKCAVFDRSRRVGDVGRSAAPALLGWDRDENQGWEDTAMRVKHPWWSGLVAACSVGWWA